MREIFPGPPIDGRVRGSPGAVAWIYKQKLIIGAFLVSVSVAVKWRDRESAEGCMPGAAELVGNIKRYRNTSASSCVLVLLRWL